MNLRTCLHIAASAVMIGSAGAQSATRAVKVRLVYFEPAKDDPTALFAHYGNKGKSVKIVPGSNVTDDKIDCPVPSAGEVIFSRSADARDAVAAATIPAGVKEANLFFLKRRPPAPDGLLYQVVVVDNSRSFLPHGGVCVYNLTASPGSVTVGDTTVDVAPDLPVAIKKPRELDEYNMAAFKVRLKEGAVWRTLKDNMMRYADSERYYAFIHTQPGGGRPGVKIYKQVMPVPESNNH